MNVDVKESFTHHRPFWRSVTTAERRSLLGMAAVVIVLHVVGFGLLLGVIAPQHLHLGGEHPVLSVGVGVLAYSFGLRHAFDADHIAAIDNTTRKLIADDPARSRRRPLSVGFWFSLGHSTVVFLLALLLAFGVKRLAAQVEDGGSRLHELTGVIGATVSGTFLWILGLVNLAAVVGIIKAIRDLRAGHFDEAELERRLNQRGLMNRALGGLTRSVRSSAHIYPVGVLFGLGFDTATEIGLLVLAGGAAALALPFYAILVLPVLFAAGMCLMDTVDGVFMNVAYGWALSRPTRKLFYNVTSTSLSVAAALGIGTIELAGVVADEAGITHGPIAALGDVPINAAGYLVVALFIVTWAAALAVWKLGRIEERWSPVPVDRCLEFTDAAEASPAAMNASSVR